MTVNIIKKSLDRILRIKLLIRHFILRYINNEALLFDNLRRVNLIALLSLLSVSIGFLSHIQLRLYLFGLKPNPADIWLEKVHFLTICMALVGIIYTIMWDNLSPDRRDYANLLMLPVKPRDLFFAKFLSALVLAAFTTLTFNILSTFIFSFYLTRQLHINPMKLGVIHLTTHFLAYLFLFFFIAGIQSAVRSLVKPRWYRAASSFIQIILFTLFISLLIWFPGVFPLLSSLKTESSTFIFGFPPMWFTGIGEYLMGNHDSVFSAYPHIMVMALAVPAGIFLLGMPVYFRRFLKTRADVISTAGPSRFKSWLKKSFERLALRQQPVRASYYFSIKTLNRCRKHKIHLLTFWIIPLSLVFAGLVALYVNYETAFLKTPNLFLISIPITLLFFLIWGIRTVITYPINPKANWIFILKSFPDNWQVARGLKRAFLFSIVLPLMAIILVVYAHLWGFMTALGHVSYCIFSALLITTILFINYRKQPFISSRKNQHSNHRLVRPFVLVLFLFLIYLFSILGKFLVKNPEFYILFYLGLSILFFMLQWIQAYLQKELVFSYNPILQRVMVQIRADSSSGHPDMV